MTARALPLAGSIPANPAAAAGLATAAGPGALAGIPGASTRLDAAGRAAARAAARASHGSETAARARREGGLVVANVEIRLASALGFCHGVERAVALAHEARARFPDRRIALLGELVHHPRVNAALDALGVDRLPGALPSALSPGDVALVPAFGLPVSDVEALEARGAVVVDTTCGEVMAVWKAVERWAQEGRTIVLHGKAGHEEVRATCSRAARHGAPWLVVRDLAEARAVAAAVRDGAGAVRAQVAPGPWSRPGAASPGFDPRRDLASIGVANQTTMLAGESLAVAAELQRAFAARFGPDEGARRARTVDTICSATQDRQDALEVLLAAGCDLALVVGGHGSHNTAHLAAIAGRAVPTFHVEDARDVSDREVRHRPSTGGAAITTRDWLPESVRRIAVTAGASTPDDVLGEVLERLSALLEARPSA